MTWVDPILNLAQKAVDSVADHWPAPEVTKEQLAAARVIAHRGAFGPGIKENLCTSLSECATAGIWGAEFDVRWTPDETPVLLHDPLPDRSRADRLDTAVQNPGGHTHMMIEVKEPLSPARERILKAMLGGLTPVTDYHFLTLDPAFLEGCQIFPKSAFVYVTETRPRRASAYVLENRWGGIAGHYLLINDRIISRHKEAGQAVGVGFVASPNNLCRQLARGVDWVFSNNAPVLQTWLKARLDGSGGAG
jgi:glycerophosphoryl diester phosphodiesterase